ncbi:MAG: endonuclease/exonuclease/phosphatase family protein [Verrucomicrobiales bacterium]|nr:endonuclease/exonuclease/phosphatase family protein [Verrucomicrobiales bacterium]
MRVLSYNIHGCVGTDRKYNPDRICSIIEQSEADIVALQEVYEYRSIKNFFHTLEALKGYHIIRGPTLDREDGSYGNVLMSRYPVLQEERIDISVPHREPRGAIRVMLEADDELVEVTTTHLGLTAGERIRQLEKLIESGDKNPDPDLRIFAGDLNDWFSRSRFSRLLEQRYGNVPKMSPRTFPAFLPLLKLDRIIVDPPGRLLSLAILNLPFVKKASDHLPLLGEIKGQT